MLTIPQVTQVTVQGLGTNMITVKSFMHLITTVLYWVMGVPCIVIVPVYLPRTQSVHDILRMAVITIH